MNLKFLFFSALTGFALICCLTTTSYAQRSTPIGERIKMGNAEQIGEQEQNLIFALELNTTQADKFMAINEKYREAMNGLSSSPDFNTAEKQEYYQVLRDEQNKEMKSFMSKAQYKKIFEFSATSKKSKDSQKYR